jgi:hypothetical protein
MTIAMVCVNLWIGIEVVNALNINNDETMMRFMIGKVAERLWSVTISVVLLTCIEYKMKRSST